MFDKINKIVFHVLDNQYTNEDLNMLINHFRAVNSLPHCIFIQCLVCNNVESAYTYSMPPSETILDHSVFLISVILKKPADKDTGFF